MTSSCQPTTEATPEVLPEAFLRSLVRLALYRLTEDRPDLELHADTATWVQCASQVLAANIASGRIKLACHVQPVGLTADATLLSYAGQVLVELLTESERIAALIAGDTEAWQAVIRRLERLAYHWFGPQGRDEWAACEARDVAAKTCVELWSWLQTHAYPFDVPFDRWSLSWLYKRLQGHVRCLKREQRRTARVIEAALVTVDGSGEPIEVSLADHSLSEWLDQTANREALMQAMACLDGRDEEILRLWYLEQQSADEIAAQIGIRVGDVYVQRFRALKKLRHIVIQDKRLGLVPARALADDESRRLRPIPVLGESTS